MERDGRDGMNDLFGKLMSKRSGGKGMNIPSELTWEPAADVIETGKELVIMIDFGREIDLLVPVDPGKVTARYRNGLLEVRLRKLGDSERIKKIQID